MKTIDFHTALRRLLNAEDVLILTHASPDGDTLGSGYALFRGLLLLGKRVKLLYTIPNFHNPAGVTLAVDRRA